MFPLFFTIACCVAGLRPEMRSLTFHTMLGVRLVEGRGFVFLSFEINPFQKFVLFQFVLFSTQLIPFFVIAKFHFLHASVIAESIAVKSCNIAFPKCFNFLHNCICKWVIDGICSLIYSVTIPSICVLEIATAVLTATLTNRFQRT